MCRNTARHAGRHSISRHEGALKWRMYTHICTVTHARAKTVVHAGDLTSPSWHVNFYSPLLAPPLGTSFVSYGCKRIAAGQAKCFRTLTYPPWARICSTCPVCCWEGVGVFYLEQFKQSKLPENDNRSSAKKYCVCSVMQACLCLPSDISSSISAAGWISGAFVWTDTSKIYTYWHHNIHTDTKTVKS